LNLRLDFPRGQAALVKRAIHPEINAKHARRSTTSIGIKSTTISINIKASDASALRASLNGCTGSIILSKDILEV
jgi:tRNA threonylcarbamoyladenosine modification (KEOPS) complex  Pcc1 subunit